MGRNDQDFTPDEVDEQIEWLTESGLQENGSDAQSTLFIQQLQRHYQNQRREIALQRVWHQIEQRYHTAPLAASTEAIIQYERQKPESADQLHMQAEITRETSSPKSFSRWELIAIVAVTFLLIGGTVLMTSLIPQLKGGLASGGGNPDGSHSNLQPTCIAVSGTQSTDHTEGAGFWCSLPSTPYATPVVEITCTPTATPSNGTATPPHSVWCVPTIETICTPTPTPSNSTPVATPTRVVWCHPTPTPIPSPTPAPQSTPTPMPTPTPAPQSTPTPAPTPTPIP